MSARTPEWLIGELAVLRAAPRSVAVLVVLSLSAGAYAAHFLLSERIEVLEERLRLQTDALTRRDRIPLPSPVSLGGTTGTTYIRFTQANAWVPPPEHEEAPIHWESLSDDIEVYAEVIIASVVGNEGGALFARARLVDVLSGEIVGEFGPIVATPREDRDAPASLVSRPVPRSGSQRRYRLEVSGDPGVAVTARGRLLYRRRTD